MKKVITSPLFYLLFTICVFYFPVIRHSLVPAPADALVGLYHPYRDLYSTTFPRGIPFKNSLITDPVRQQYPWKFLSIESLSKLLPPLWNPYNFAGTPLLGTFQAGVFYPVNFVFLMLSFTSAWTIFIMLQTILGGIFMYLYLRHLRLHPFAQFLGSLVFVFCGFSIAWLEWGSIISTLVWLPLILLAVDHNLEKPTVKWMSVFFVAVVSSFFAGHLQTFIYVITLSTTYLILKGYGWSKKQSKRFGFWRLVLPSVGLLALAGIITSIQWVPTVRFIGESARSADQIGGWQKAGWFIPWQHLIQFLIPDYFGNPATGNYWGVWNYGEFIGYVGLIPLLFALLAVMWRRDKKTYFFGGIILVSLIFATPNNIAKIPYIMNIPLLSSTQPTRLMSLVDFSLAILSALGLDYFITHKRRIGIPLGILGGLLGGILILTKFVIVPSIGNSYQVVILSNSKLPVLLFLIMTIACIGTLILRQKRLHVLLIIVLLFLSAADLLRFGQKFTPFTNPQYLYPNTPVLSYLQGHIGMYRLMAVDDEILPPNVSGMYHLQDVDGYDPLYLRRYGELMIASERNAPDVSVPFGFNRIITPKRIDSPVIDMLGVKYILSLTDLNDPKVKKVFQEGETRVYENTNVFPRAFFVTHVLSATSKEQALDPYFMPNFDFHDNAVIENDQQNLNQTIYASGSAVQISSYTPDNIAMHVHAPGESYLVLTDIYYPMWHAVAYNKDTSVDIPIIRTDYAFRGMVIPKGDWTLILKPSLF